MAYAAQYTLARDTTFLQRVQIAIISAAISIQNESPTATNHAARGTFALKVLANPEEFAAQMAYGIVADPTISSGSADSALDTRIASIWDSYALVK